jgi:hypothetical protein
MLTAFGAHEAEILRGHRVVNERTGIEAARHDGNGRPERSTARAAIVIRCAPKVRRWRSRRPLVLHRMVRMIATRWRRMTVVSAVMPRLFVRRRAQHYRAGANHRWRERQRE